MFFLPQKKQAEIPTEEYYIPFGQAAVVRSGADITLVAVGAHVHTSLAAATTLAAEGGLECEVIDLRTIVPMDTATIIASVRKTGRLLVVDEAYSMCGIGAEVISAVVGADGLLSSLKAPPGRLHTAASAMPFSPALEEAVTVTAASVCESVRGLFETNQAPIQTGPVLTTQEAAHRDAQQRAEESALDGQLPIFAPFRAGSVSYLFGVPITLERWLVGVGDEVTAGDEIAIFSVAAEDVNTGLIASGEFPILAPVGGRLTAHAVAPGEETQLGKRVALMRKGGA